MILIRYKDIWICVIVTDIIISDNNFWLDFLAFFLCPPLKSKEGPYTGERLRRGVWL